MKNYCLLLCTCLCLGFAHRLWAQSTAKPTLLEAFRKPDTDAKGMFRWWFPSAEADERLIQEHIQSLYTAGFGGVEVALVPHNTRFDARIDGWGTEKWKRLMKTVLKAANQLPGKFKVDFTISAHWPPALNTIDPNQMAASQELAYTYTKLRTGQAITLPLPKTKEKDRDGTSFIFTDTFVGASIAQVKQVDGKKITLDWATVRDVSRFASRLTNPDGTTKTTPAGVPANATQFGSKPRLADKQYYWTATVDASVTGKAITSVTSDTAIQTGDWLLFAYYQRGTGETISGVGMMDLYLPMADGMYAADYFSPEGSRAIADYWQQHLLNDSELVALLKQTQGDIFEDSIESFSTGPFWSAHFLSAFRQYRHYDLAPYLPFIASAKGSRLKFLSSAGNTDRVREDYYQTLNDLYVTNHIQAIQAWTHTFGYGYRAQAYGASIETSGASALLDVTEGESLGFMGQYEHFRDLAGGVHMAGKKFVSDEALANLGGTYKLNWKEAARTLYENYAVGVNRAIFHGTSYPKEPSGQFNQWPGWHPFQSAFAEPWDRRQIFWDDVNALANFVARTQAVLQNGQPQVDIAVYKNTLDYGKGLPELPKAGYTYDIIGTPLLLHKNARLNDRQSGQQRPTFGPAQYKAIVVNQQETTTLPAARQLLTFAKAGLPVILLGQVPKRLSGVSGEQVSSLTNALPTDAQLRAILTQLTDLPNAVRVADATQLIAALTQLNIVPRVAGKPASGSEALQTVCRRDIDGALYYYLFNSSDSTLATSLQVEAADLPHQLSLWSGDIRPIARYTRTQTGTSFPLTLQPKEAVVVGFLKTSVGQKATISPTTARQTALPLTDWTLQIESWGPGNDPNRPFVSTKTRLDLGRVPLVTWNKLPVPPDLRAKAGVDSLAYVSGIGYYTTTFTPGTTWTKGQSVWLKLVNSDDIVAAVTINGTTLTGIDPMTLLLDIGPYVKPGSNNLQIKLVTTLINRVAMEHPLYKGGRGLFGPPPGAAMEKPDEDEPGPSFPSPPPMRHKFYYGLVGAELRMETR